LDFPWEATKRNKKTKVVVVLHLADEDNFGTFANDHEELRLENENLQELHAKNE
jgi:hypothetical protein